MRVVERPFSEFLRQPNEVVAELEEHDVVLRRRNAPSLRLSDASRDARHGAGDRDEVVDECLELIARDEAEYQEAQALKDRADLARRDANAVWPWGLGFLVALGIGSVVVAERRVRTPVRHLPSGTRIA